MCEPRDICVCICAIFLTGLHKNNMFTEDDDEEDLPEVRRHMCEPSGMCMCVCVCICAIFLTGLHKNNMFTEDDDEEDLPEVRRHMCAPPDMCVCVYAPLS